MKRRGLFSVAGVLLLSTMPAWADVVNGGFEAGLAGWNATGAVSATSFEMSRDFLAPVGPDWTPTGGQLFASLWSTDNAGITQSSLSQTFTANAGDVLSFDYFFDFGDFATDPDTAIAVLSWSNGSVTLFEHNTPGYALGDDENVGWTTITRTLSATDMYTLTFTTTDGPGVFESILGVDRVSLNPIPAPGAALLAMLGLGLVGWLRRRLAGA